MSEYLDLEDPNQIVVTGMGLVSPLGNTVTKAMDNVFAGRDGIGLIDSDFSDRYPQLRAHVSAPVTEFNINDDPILNIPNKELPWIHQSAKFALWAITQALRQSDLVGDIALERGSPISPIEFHSNQVDPRRIAISMGTGMGGAEEVAGYRYIIDTISEDGSRKRLKPRAILPVLPERVATVPSMRLGIRGPVMEVTGACATGNLNINNGARLLKLDEADVAVVGGAEAQITPAGIALFEASTALDSSTDPKISSRPFHPAMNGFVMGEGAGALVLETYQHAKNRGAPILARLVGYGETSDAGHDTAPNGIGAAEALHKAICMIKGIGGAEALRRDVGSESLDGVLTYINAHATGTRGDSVELGAIAEVFKDKDLVAGISSTKGATGHLLGAAGVFEAIVSISALQRGEVPPSLKLDDIIPETAGWHMSPHVATSVPGLKEGMAFNDSFGFGGINAVNVWKR